MVAPEGTAVGVATTVAEVTGRAEDPGVERIPVTAGPAVEPETETVAQTPVVVLVVAARNPADVGRPPVPVDVAGGVPQTREPEPPPGRMPVPTAVVVGERTPGIPSHPVEPGRSVRPPAPAVGLPVLLDARLPGPSIVDLDPLAMRAQRVAVTARIDGGIGHETGPMAFRPVIERGSSRPCAALELDPGIVETVGHERLAAADDHRSPLRHDFRESGENRHLGPAATVAVNLVAAVLLHVDPGVGCVQDRQLRFEKVTFDLQAQPAPVQDVERVLVFAVRRSGDPLKSDLRVVVQGQDRTVRHEDRESRARRRPDPVASQNRQVEFKFALSARTGREQGRVSVQRADETVDAREALRLFLARSIRCPDGGCGKDERRHEDADRKQVSHLSVPLWNRSQCEATTSGNQQTACQGDDSRWLPERRTIPVARRDFESLHRGPARFERDAPVTFRGRPEWWMAPFRMMPPVQRRPRSPCPSFPFVNTRIRCCGRDARLWRSSVPI